MTIADYINKLDAKLAKIKSGKWLQLASLDAQDAMSERIFIDNENIKGQTFKYSIATKKKKNAKGRFSVRVNFTDTNDLQLDFNNSSNGVKPTKIDNFSYKISLKRSRNERVRKSLDKRYGFVFKIKNSEKKVFIDSANKNFKLIFAK